MDKDLKRELKSDSLSYENSSRAKLKESLKNDSISSIDLDELNERNVKNYRSSRRKKVVIIVLVVLLLLAITGVSISYFISSGKNNCFLNAYGAEVQFVVEGENLSEFRAPYEVTGNRVYEVKLDVNLISKGTYDVKFRIRLYEKNTLLNNTLAYELNSNLFRYSVDGFYHSKQAIEGGQAFNLCSGVIIDSAYEDSLNSKNFKMEVDIYFEKI